jgi:hypothetical protein
MEIGAVVERVGHISAVRSNPAADADLVQSGLVAIREVQAWCDAQHAGLVARLRDVDSFPEQRIAKASKKSLGHAAKSTERSNDAWSQTPKLADALDDGAITADHVDAVTRASKQLDGPKRAELIARADALADVARAGTVEEFARRLDVERKRLQDDDGMVQAMFAETVPDESPSDPIEKQRYLAGHTDGSKRTSGPSPPSERCQRCVDRGLVDAAVECRLDHRCCCSIVTAQHGSRVDAADSTRYRLDGAVGLIRRNSLSGEGVEEDPTDRVDGTVGAEVVRVERRPLGHGVTRNRRRRRRRGRRGRRYRGSHARRPTP